MIFVQYDIKMFETSMNTKIKPQFFNDFIRDARYISHHIGIGRYMFIFNVIVIGPIRNFGRYIKADK